MTPEPADRQVSYKKNTHARPFPILSCIESIAAPVMGGGWWGRGWGEELSQEEGETDTCIIMLICRKDDLEYFLCVSGPGVHDVSERGTSEPSVRPRKVRAEFLQTRRGEPEPTAHFFFQALEKIDCFLLI